MGDKTTKTYLGLGSNLGDRLANLEMGIKWLKKDSTIRIMRISPLYETQAWSDKNQPDFLNCVVSTMVKKGAYHLLMLCQEAEAQAGRLTRSDDAPRPLDIDILLFGSELINKQTLVIPHPRLSLRRFVLQPLSDIAPNLIVPGLGQKVSTLLKNCSDKHWIKRIAEVV